MNIFIIPSWYPSNSHPLPGIFFKEQAQIFARIHPDINIGISTWGQNDERLLLWINNPLKNLLKLINRWRIESNQVELLPNCTEYFMPSFTWSRYIFKGNISGIHRANRQNLKLYIKKFGHPDIILAHVGYPAGYLASLLSKENDIPYVVVENMSPLPFKDYIDCRGYWMKNLQVAYDKAFIIIPVSKSLSDKFRRGGYSNIKVITNFINDKFFHLSKDTSISNKLIALTIGRLESQKGIDILLNAIHKTNSNFNFKIGGSGTQSKFYKSRATKLLIQDKVSWLGSVNRMEVLQELQKCSLFVLPSRHENMPLVLLEALACGKPCIVTECGGPEEIITDEVGIVVEKENPEALAKAIDYMANNLDKYPAEKIRKYFDEHFSARKITNLLRKVFEEAIQSYKTN